MTTEGVQRKMAAILCADVEGYTRLMQDDPEATLLTLKEYRAVFKNCSESLNGRIVDSPGDNILIEFPMTVDAVQCAVEIQRKLIEKNTELSENRCMQFRIGIDSGDLLEEDGSLYGDGVNISARLQSLAESGGICISGRAHDQVVNRLPLKFEFLGKQSVKNIADPIRVYRVLIQPETAGAVVREKKASKVVSRRLAVTTFIALIIIAAGSLIWMYSYQSGKIEQSSESEQAPTVVDVEETKKTIAVLPFADMSPDKNQEYFVDGLSEEILNSLTQIPNLQVIARTSSFSFKETNKKVQEIAGELGANHILEGSVRKAGNALRITAQLIRAADGIHLWSGTYDRKLEDIFAVQEDIATAVANELKLTLGIGNSIKQSGGTDNVEAYGHYLVAKGKMWSSNRVAAFEKCLESLDAAISLDPAYALAWAQKAQYHLMIAIHSSKDRVQTELDAGLKAAQRAIQIEPGLPEAYAALVSYYVMKSNWIEAERAVQKALDLKIGILSDVDLIIAKFYNEVGFFKKAKTVHEELLSNDPLNKEACADRFLVLAFRGYTHNAEEEYELGRDLFGGEWLQGDSYISYIRLGYKETISRNQIVYTSPIFDVAKEHLESPEKALSELHRIYANDENLSHANLMEIGVLAAHFGDAEFALEATMKGVRLNAAGIFHVWYPVMHEVRQLPRFKEFIRRIGLVDYWEKFGWPDLCHPTVDGDFVCE